MEIHNYKIFKYLQINLSRQHGILKGPVIKRIHYLNKKTCDVTETARRVKQAINRGWTNGEDNFNGDSDGVCGFNGVVFDS